VRPLPVIHRVDAARRPVISTDAPPVGDSTDRVGDENKIHIQLLVASLLVADTAPGVGGRYVGQNRLYPSILLAPEASLLRSDGAGRCGR